ncbi:CD206 [Mytilus edulis]|uniref:MRC n=1 Tax=Mytilus edulis TaxID=6550 RepID=A0A8S3QVX5_MYTED|nr:CD206 [Mytilus edulis]
MQKKFVGNNLKTADILLVQCADIPTDSLINGTVTVTERNVGSMANFTCDADLSLVGRKSIMCTTSGWNGNIPQCTKIVCPETVAFFRGSKYIFKCNVGNWFTSEDNCNASGGQLTSIETGDENTFLVDVITLIMNIQRLRGYFWIGLTDNNDEMSYKWLSGEPLNYKNWYQGQPQQPDHINYQGSTGAHCEKEKMPNKRNAIGSPSRAMGKKKRTASRTGGQRMQNEEISPKEGRSWPEKNCQENARGRTRGGRRTGGNY